MAKTTAKMTRKTTRKSADAKAVKTPKVADALKKSRAKKTAPHIIVGALAGTGKTTTAIGGLNWLRGIQPEYTPSPQQQAVWDALAAEQYKAVCCVAFNKSIATELQSRVPEGVDAMTMHSMGMKAVREQFGRIQVSSWRVTDIISEITETDVRELRKFNNDMLKGTERLVGLCKLSLIDETDTDLENILDGLCSHYDVELNGSRDEVYELVPKVLARCKEVDKDKRIDFNDMIWLPVVLSLPVKRYDLLIVDEAQDLNKCQQALAYKAGSRLMFVGDVNQAIYGFAGADAESMNRLEAELGATDRGVTVLPLTVTRRCSKAVVADAQAYVPTFEAHESNLTGSVSEVSEDRYVDLVQDGDMIVCRVNAPLVSQCFRFIADGRKANIQGRDIGQGLVRLIKKQKCADDDMGGLMDKLSTWYFQECLKEAAKKNPSDARLIALEDRYKCLTVFCDNATTVSGVITKIEDVFSDDKGEGIRLSSIHKAKGLESDRVFFFRTKDAPCPHPMAKQAWAKEQERNLCYVAITRAIESLYYVK